jgi:large subunit ribosomal protein L4
MVLSDRAANNGLAILEKFDLEACKTKVVNEVLMNLEEKVFNVFKTDDKKKDKKIRTTGRSILLINDASNDKVVKSARNLEGVKIINLENINIVDLLNCKNLIVTEKAIDKLEAVYKKE